MVHHTSDHLVDMVHMWDLMDLRCMELVDILVDLDSKHTDLVDILVDLDLLRMGLADYILGHLGLLDMDRLVLVLFHIREHSDLLYMDLLASVPVLAVVVLLLRVVVILVLFVLLDLIHDINNMHNC